MRYRDSIDKILMKKLNAIVSILENGSAFFEMKKYARIPNNPGSKKRTIANIPRSGNVDTIAVILSEENVPPLLNG